MERVEVAPDGWNFRTRDSHSRFIPFGTNAIFKTPLPGEWHDILWFMTKNWDRELFTIFLDHIAAVGMNVVKVFLPVCHVLPDPQPHDHAAIAPGVFERLDEALALANERGIYLIVTLSEWGGNGLEWWHAGGEYVGRLPDMAGGPDSVAVVTDFWRTLAARYKGAPGIFAYDLAVEWLMPNGNMSNHHKKDGLAVLTYPGADDAWRHWLKRRYGSGLELNRAWGDAVKGFDDICTPSYAFEDGKYVAGDQVIYDYQEFREWVCYHYLKAQTDAIRSVDPTHMVTCGVDPRRPYGLGEHAGGPGGARMWGGFSPTEFDFLDYISDHEYVIEGTTEGYRPAPGKDGTRMLRAAVNHLRFCHIGKPVILEEYGYQGTPDPERAAELAEQLVNESASGCAGWMVWYGTQPPINPKDPERHSQGIYLVDGDDPRKAKWRLTLWGEKLKKMASPGGFLSSLPMERPAPRTVIEFDRRRELVPTGPTSMGYILDHWDEYEHPMDFIWPGNRHLDISLK